MFSKTNISIQMGFEDILNLTEYFLFTSHNWYGAILQNLNSKNIKLNNLISNNLRILRKKLK